MEERIVDRYKYFNLDGQTIAQAIQDLQELQKEFSPDHKLNISSVQDLYSDDYSVGCCVPYKSPETAEEVEAREQDEKRELRYKKNQYERWKREFEK